ncbi:FAD-dependent oxidoreductase [Hahella aquimaris]|uniref:NAD(P)/FAD-dependent oxidoreductase n=1 Tax=Hahella sp. HNIBRBA332 TaxID=3015983 RepID=UPI00273C256E|nr:FAD-dependent oxidoreductase [Hahella sp. HNIBRBA332]WLQ12755.1 FAD-dependent oxidoreductase [Hahella sp. HNIBRBA332]
MNIAIIGAGVSGLTAAYYLHKNHDVTLYEANARPGGHTDTHSLRLDGQDVAVDSGFIVFNERNYPRFCDMLRELGVQWRDSDMSFSAVNEATGMEYGAAGLSRLLAQKRNLLRPDFYLMLKDLARFYKEAPERALEVEADLTLGEFLRQDGYSRAFIDNHIVPMACALWSASARMIESFPFRFFISFMDNHRMLQLRGRPQWKVVQGGAQQYVKRIQAVLGPRVRLSCPVAVVSRCGDSVMVHSERYGAEKYDAVVFACHSDQALTLLKDADRTEREVLGAIPYQENLAVVHSDARAMPSKRAAWASWNAFIPRQATQHCSVSYWMNSLQGLTCETPMIVTLNPTFPIAPEKVYARRTYAHPVYTHETLTAQARREEINGRRNTYFCGAYWGWGFHEDGVRSALDVVSLIQRRRYGVAA